MGPEAFIPQELLDRITIRVTRLDKEIGQKVVYTGPDASIALLENLFPERLDYSRMPEDGLTITGTVMEIEIEPLTGFAFAAVIKNSGSKDNGSINILKNRAEEPGRLFYRQKITFHAKLGYVGAFTMSPANCVRILAAAVDTGKLYHIEIALISQVPEAYGSDQACKSPTYAVTKQLSRHGHCYRHEGRVIFPPFAKWQESGIASDWREINDAITDLFGDKISNLEPVENHRPVVNLAAIEPEDLVGQVAETVWWSLSRQDGMVILGDGRVAKIYWRNLKRLGKLIYLTPGEIVEFQEIGMPQTTRHKTTFKWEIFGAEVIERRG
jgi:hypothetical protein